MTPNSSTLTLTTAGQTAAAATVGFDQNGNPMPSDFKMPAVSYSIDDTAGAVVKVVDNGDGTASLTAVASGSAKLTATSTSAEGLSLTDTALISVSISSGGVPVLSSIKIIF